MHCSELQGAEGPLQVSDALCLMMSSHDHLQACMRWLIMPSSHILFCFVFNSSPRTMAMRQQNMDDRRRAMMNEMYSRPGANGVSGQASANANAADEDEEGS